MHLAGAEPHGERHRAVAVGQDLHGRGPGNFPDFRDGGGIILCSDVISCELCGSIRQIDAGAKIEQPNVVLRGKKILKQVSLNRID